MEWPVWVSTIIAVGFAGMYAIGKHVSLALAYSMSVILVTWTNLCRIVLQTLHGESSNWHFVLELGFWLMLAGAIMLAIGVFLGIGADGLAARVAFRRDVWALIGAMLVIVGTYGVALSNPATYIFSSSHSIRDGITIAIPITIALMAIALLRLRYGQSRTALFGAAAFGTIYVSNQAWVLDSNYSYSTTWTGMAVAIYIGSVVVAVGGSILALAKAKYTEDERMAR